VTPPHTIYVVVEGYGDYSDRSEVPTRAYRMEASARAYIADQERKLLEEHEAAARAGKRPPFNQPDFVLYEIDMHALFTEGV
jgi:hypothetical protein